MISIIMPAYNSESYVSEAIESVCKQSYADWELLIVNDGATDQTPEIIEKYAQKDSRIRVFHRKNEGVSMARNFALDQVYGEYVTFIDSDDVYHVDRLKEMMQVFELTNNCDIVFSRHREFKGKLTIGNEDNTQNIDVIDDNILKKVISDTKYHFMCNVMIRSDIAQKEKFAPMRFAEDFCYIRDCVSHCRQMAFLDEILYFYRRDNENAMTSHFFSEKYVPDYIKLVENIYSFCKKHQLNEGFYKKMVAHEYAQNSMRIRKSTSYRKFVVCMNDTEFRAGIQYADASMCTLFEKILFILVKYKIYFPLAFWVW